MARRVGPFDHATAVHRGPGPGKKPGSEPTRMGAEPCDSDRGARIAPATGTWCRGDNESCWCKRPGRGRRHPAVAGRPAIGRRGTIIPASGTPPGLSQSMASGPLSVWQVPSRGRTWRILGSCPQAAGRRKQSVPRPAPPSDPGRTRAESAPRDDGPGCAAPSDRWPAGHCRVAPPPPNRRLKRPQDSLSRRQPSSRRQHGAWLTGAGAAHGRVRVGPSARSRGLRADQSQDEQPAAAVAQLACEAIRHCPGLIPAWATRPSAAPQSAGCRPQRAS